MHMANVENEKRSSLKEHYNYMRVILNTTVKKSTGSPYSITERRVPELIPVLGSQPAGDVSHKSGGRLPLLSAKTTIKHHSNFTYSRKIN